MRRYSKPRKVKLSPFFRSTIRLLSSLITTPSFANSSRSRRFTAFPSHSLTPELRNPLAQPPFSRLHQPVPPPFGVDQDHHVIRKTCILDVGVLAPPRGVHRFLQHPVYLIQIEVAEQRRYHSALGNAFLPGRLQNHLEQMHDRIILDPSRHFL